MGIYQNRDRMWFGTEAKMGWIETPQTGADVSPESYSTSATLMNGGGYGRTSWGSHKQFQFAWGESADRRLAMKIHAYANGTYGRGLIYFIDPMFYDLNILPKHWADPSMALNFEAPTLIRDLAPRSTPTGSNTNDLPVQTAIYDVPAGYDAEVAGDELFVPIPEGAEVMLGAFWSSPDGLANLYYRTSAGRTNFTKTAVNDAVIAPQTVAGFPWVRIGIANTAGTTQPVLITAMTARILDEEDGLLNNGPWVGGEGHSGCIFEGKPTLILYSGIQGGRVGLACTLKEVGGWA